MQPEIKVQQKAKLSYKERYFSKTKSKFMEMPKLFEH
jgi:hypothetical protein